MIRGKGRRRKGEKRIALIKDDGTIKGGWIATCVTLLTFGFFGVGVFWGGAADNLEKFGLYLASAYSVTIGAYLLKKYKEDMR
jgi:hypothetical protein